MIVPVQVSVPCSHFVWIFWSVCHRIASFLTIPFIRLYTSRNCVAAIFLAFKWSMLHLPKPRHRRCRRLFLSGSRCCRLKPWWLSSNSKRLVTYSLLRTARDFSELLYRDVSWWPVSTWNHWRGLPIWLSCGRRVALSNTFSSHRRRQIHWSVVEDRLDLCDYSGTFLVRLVHRRWGWAGIFKAEIHAWCWFPSVWQVWHRHVHTVLILRLHDCSGKWWVTNNKLGPTSLCGNPSNRITAFGEFACTTCMLTFSAGLYSHDLDSTLPFRSVSRILWRRSTETPSCSVLQSPSSFLSCSRLSSHSISSGTYRHWKPIMTVSVCSVWVWFWLIQAQIARQEAAGWACALARTQYGALGGRMLIFLTF